VKIDQTGKDKGKTQWFGYNIEVHIKREIDIYLVDTWTRQFVNMRKLLLKLKGA